MKHFGTDGIRCREDKFTTEYLTRIAAGIASLNNCRKVVFGRDPRTSGLRIQNVMTEVISRCGVEVIIAGMVPTPTLAFLTARYGCDYGIMLSASHNPPEYNGIKLFSSSGSKVSESTEIAVENFVDEGEIVFAKTRGKITERQGQEEYIDYLSDRIKPDLRGVRVALDCANGATSIIAPELFRRAGAEVKAFFVETDGTNINDNCGATVPGTLCKIMERGDFDIGFCYDGDGDRVICVQGGTVHNGDHLMYVLSKEMKRQGTLVADTMVGTVMSNLGTEAACKKAGIRLLRTAVGDKCVFREMERHGYNIGGEESGHIILTDYMPTGDGMLASLLAAVQNKIVPISESDDIAEYPSASDSIMCDDEAKARFCASKKISEYIDNIGDEYRTVIRPSGTEPKIRILVEAADISKAQAKCAEIKGFIEEIIL